ncbi:hypothetical protein GCM10010302_10810 [Streptomyces polychromogenes]|uniref:Transposase n=1 Tax=Streptomyces polychromogenes TaxID=67342 RepID=A0ABN0V4U7_9ACTN
MTSPRCCRYWTQSQRFGVYEDVPATSLDACTPTGATKRGTKPISARRGVAHGSGLGKVRWLVEHAAAWPYQFKRLRIRYERRSDLHSTRACSTSLRPHMSSPLPNFILKDQ